MKKYALTILLANVMAYAFADVAPDPVGLESSSDTLLIIGIVAVVILLLVVRRVRKRN